MCEQERQPITIYVKNKKTYKGKGVYIGRPSSLGNPFTEREHGRDKAIKLYKDWLLGEGMESPAVRDAFDELVDTAKSQRELTLICWCAPKACHGDVLAALICEELHRQKGE